MYKKFLLNCKNKIEKLLSKQLPINVKFNEEGEKDIVFIVVVCPRLNVVYVGYI